MLKVEMKDLKQHVRNLISRTKENSYQDSGTHRCEKSDGRIYVAALDKNGRAMEFFEIIQK